ncbi:chromosome segregation protein SMC [Chryseomicrobium palamuruense]|uniref:Chromosome partition protein Smc n=1 Tax=Chryseomicrobium palamuruense TaxID=682973 RepID=A0ABV8UT41_9BACL
MFLKRLEIVGFKSFAERIAVDFVPGVTAVVGPNGSGKSNITDAIRWVLGEQSAKSLRGSKMEDVIFAGSASRKQLNFAEVTLVLDNSQNVLQTEYEEVSVTRRVYRSGDSDYLLNRQNCRLKDITELFMDSGLGREAFSIISQGKVDEILNSKAEDRRAIFEETAGVLKYKQRKRKAEYKLIETDDNLSRVRDILHELEARIEPLQIQASIARDYLDFSSELKDREVNVTIFDMSEAMKNVTSENQLLESLQQQSDEIANNRRSLSQQLAKLREELAQKEQLLDEKQDLAVNVTSDLERQEGRKLVLLEKEQNAHQQANKLQEAIRTAELELTELEQRHLQIVNALQEKQRIHSEKRLERKRLEQLLHTSEDELEVQIDQLKADYIEILNEEAALKNEQRMLEAQVEKQSFQWKRVEQEGQTVKHELQQAEEREVSLRLVKEQAEEKLEKALDQYKQKKNELNELTDTYETKRQVLFEGYQQLQGLKARRDSLEDLEAEFTGYFQGVRELLKLRDKKEMPGVEGAVAELLTIPPDYVQAIDTAIGGQAQHIVMQDAKSARQAIAYLKTKHLGRATFLPLDTMKPRFVQPNSLRLAEQHSDFIATANTLVQTEPRFVSIRDHLLGHIVIAKSLKGANEIAKLLNFSYRVVTIEGDVVNPGGSLTGGALKKQSSVFTRKTELTKLVGSVEKLEKDLQKAESTVHLLKEQKSAKEVDLESLRETGEKLRSEQQRMVSDWTAAVSTADRLRDRYTRYSLQQEEQGSDHLEAQQRIQVIANQLADYLTSGKELSSQIEELNNLKSQSVKHRDTIQNQLGELMTTIAVLSEQIHQLERDQQMTTESMVKAQAQIHTWKQELEWYQNDSEGQSLPDVEKQIEILKLQKQQLGEEITALRSSRQQLHQSIRTLELEETRIGDQQQETTIRIEKLQFHSKQRQELITKGHELLEDRYETTYEEALTTFTQPDDLDRERAKIRLLKKSIDELGPVNISAVEEFEQVKERYDFLHEQREDLLAAKETLHDAISEMDMAMTERFSTTFFAIQEHFRSVFRKLFGGGQADLVLTDPSNMLETGIEIVAQPPGKKLQNLSLLSGGERALTAIALLFAILQTRPVPFCILDEVEAALDEANVVRYSNYLHQFSGETQFIVITHRKGTMEGADVLYGVTMQESGVSKLVSVKLEEYV